MKCSGLNNGDDHKKEASTAGSMQDTTTAYRSPIYHCRRSPISPPSTSTPTYIWSKEFVLGIVMTFAKDKDCNIFFDALFPVWTDAVALRTKLTGVYLVNAEHAVANFASEAFIYIYIYI